MCYSNVLQIEFCFVLFVSYFYPFCFINFLRFAAVLQKRLGLCFVFVVINPCMLSADRVDLGFFFFLCFVSLIFYFSIVISTLTPLFCIEIYFVLLPAATVGDAVEALAKASGENNVGG